MGDMIQKQNNKKRMELAQLSFYTNTPQVDSNIKTMLFYDFDIL